ncbi:MAG: HalOD1 output domain-containing protein [Halorubrum sp.]|uniref:HalOD1 output domain-containing protein n=1 Tax=Halorubrum sp. TaxID=1879286 RepID=UPI003970E337
MSSAPTSDSDTGSLSEVTRVSHRCDDRTPSLAIVEAIADLTGVEPGALAHDAGIVLYDHVDPDAIDTLVAHHPDSGVDLSFTVDEYDVRVDPDEVVVRVAE